MGTKKEVGETQGELKVENARVKYVSSLCIKQGTVGTGSCALSVVSRWAVECGGNL